MAMVPTASFAFGPLGAPKVCEPGPESSSFGFERAGEEITSRDSQNECVLPTMYSVYMKVCSLAGSAPSTGFKTVSIDSCRISTLQSCRISIDSCVTDVDSC